MNKYMEIAIKESKKCLKTGDVPVGTVIIKDDKLIVKAHNEKEKTKNATKHAEIIAISKACKKLKTWHLDDCIMYVTMEPCLMCIGAIKQSRIKKIIYGVKNDKFGFVKSNDIVNNKNNFVMTDNDIYEDEIKQILKNFFKDKRK